MRGMKHDNNIIDKFTEFTAAIASKVDFIRDALVAIEGGLEKEERCNIPALGIGCLSHGGLSIYGRAKLGDINTSTGVYESGYFVEFNSRGWFAIGVYTGDHCLRYRTKRYNFTELGHKSISRKIADNIMENDGDPGAMAGHLYAALASALDHLASASGLVAKN